MDYSDSSSMNCKEFRGLSREGMGFCVLFQSFFHQGCVTPYQPVAFSLACEGQPFQEGSIYVCLAYFMLYS